METMCNVIFWDEAKHGILCKDVTVDFASRIPTAEECESFLNGDLADKAFNDRTSKAVSIEFAILPDKQPCYQTLQFSGKPPFSVRIPYKEIDHVYFSANQKQYVLSRAGIVELVSENGVVKYEVSKDDMNENAYMEHCLSRTAEENELVSSMYDYEEQYFADMRLLSSSIVRKYVQFRSKRDGTWIDDEDDRCLGLFDEDDFFVRIVELPSGIAGRFNNQKNELSIIPSEARNKSIVLHEMIHAHEFKLSRMTPFYRDIVLLCLYNDLAKKIPDLDNRILDHTHVIRGDEITIQGGSHDILFYLKSLDLDIRCGFPLGTVCGYGRDEQNTPE